MAELSVVIVEDQKEIREGLRALIDGTGGFHCVGAYRSMEEALERMKGASPDVALMDIGLPGMSGIEAIGLVRERHPATQILMLTIYDDDDRIFQAICAGACGYLLKKTPPTRLLDALREAIEGGAPLSPEVARRVITLFRDHRPPVRADHDLTPHEMRLLKMLVDGHTYGSAAELLGVTFNTIHFHMKRIYEKLQVHSKSEAVAKALRARLLT
jgi:DNA-binding NarL/FixJ family response regulator